MSAITKHFAPACFLAFLFASKLNAQTVYVNSHGSKYHKESCEQLGRNRSSKGIQEALTEGYKSCNSCQSRSFKEVVSNKNGKLKREAETSSHTALAEEKKEKEMKK